MSEKKFLIATLLAKQGNSYEDDGQAIATYENRHIVFMPDGTEPGKKHRVRLLPLGKKDRRGNEMYRAKPDSAAHTERWRDNGEGTISRVKVSIDWRLNEHEVEVIKTRSKASREGSPRKTTRRTPDLGSSLTDSHVEEVTVTIIPLESETVENGELVWEKTGKREEPEEAVKYPVREIEVSTKEWRGTWVSNRFQITWDTSWSLCLGMHYQDGDEVTYLDTTWGELPDWLQSEIQSRYPVCACGRLRYDTDNADGYSRCEKCRKQETCDRCGTQTKVTVLDDKSLVCNACKSLAEQEQRIREVFTSKHLQIIADEASRLHAATAVLNQDAALVVLKSGLGPVSNDMRRDKILDGWMRYRKYLVTPDGIFGTKLDKAALQILQFLPQATGNSLVELVAWVCGDVKLREHNYDFYLQTQIENRLMAPRVTQGDLQRLVQRLDQRKPVLADFLQKIEDKEEAFEIPDEGAQEALRSAMDAWSDLAE